ncbi:hypothetical protein MKW94_005440 [Papaver nudicaule]|uniref:Cathepsin propeptide inhibitor domain-containing protein n=1 Tax=Papaver nudicaule TaxID=74823 RepID=A0AA41SG01_PAPNU|nr:hypothetical protein [Papaver nudicaule]
MNKLKGIVATLSRPSSFNRARSVSFSSGAAEFVPFKPKIPKIFQVTDKDRESDENLMDLYGRWMRHFKRITTDIDEKNRRFQTFKDKVMRMDLEQHCILSMFSDSTREECANWLGCNLPPPTAQGQGTQGMNMGEWRAKAKLEGRDVETDEEMEQRLFGQVSSCSSAKFVPFKPKILESFQVTDKDRESEENLMDLYGRWMRHFGRITTDIDEKNRRFQTFRSKVMRMDLEQHCILSMFSDSTREECANWLGCKLPPPTAQGQGTQGMNMGEWRPKAKLEDRDVETHQGMERRLFGPVEL